MTYRELIYMCLDEIKLVSDDSYITEDHILFLISKYRAFLLRQKYDKTNMPVSESNYQLLEVTPSTTKVPDIMTLAKPRIKYTQNDNIKNATFVSPHRFEFVGNAKKYINTFVYCTIEQDNTLKFKDSTINSATIYAVFEDIIKVSELNATGDILDEICPIEAELVAGVQELVVKDALGIAYRPKDTINNGSDDLSTLGVASGNPKNNK